VTLRVIVVDDEALGRRGIISRLARHDDIEIVAECAGGREAIEAIRTLEPDLLFLDVQMPGLDGFDVVRELGAAARPHVIFVTAWQQHAVRAFDIHALDYLLKPVDDDRFEEALARARGELARERDSQLGRKVAGLVAGVEPKRRAGPADRYALRLKGRTVIVRHAEIDWIEAQGDYVRIHSGAKSWLVRDTMGAVERDLGSPRFLRIHRSAIVNADRVQEVRTFDGGDGRVVLRDGTELPLGRRHRQAVERLLRR
jgi:two-component system LytT family response regulator